MTKRTIAQLAGRPTLSELAATVQIDSTYVGKRAGCFDEDDTAEMHEWNSTLSYQGRTFTLPYFMGLAHSDTDKPTATDVINSLVLDSSALDETFEEWAGDFGYDTDSRKAEKMYRSCIDYAIRLKRLLGGDYAKFMAAENDI